MTLYLIIAAAAAVVLWPQRKSESVRAPGPFGATARGVDKASAGYQAAIMALTAVRHRLVKTEKLGDEERKAVDCLTLSLVNGSDME